MLLLTLAFLGGLLTILSPCILPVLPFVFARAGQPFRRGALPLLAGMAATFASVALLAAAGGGWAVSRGGFGRIAALAVLGVSGAALLLPSLAERLGRPLAGLGVRLTRRAEGLEGHGAPLATSLGSSLLLGVATGLLWAPCAGPILGLVLTASALEGTTGSGVLPLLAYGAGAATSLGLALLAGRRLSRPLRRSLPAVAALRRGMGLAVLLSVGGIFLGVDKQLLATAAGADVSTALEQALLARMPELRRWLVPPPLGPRRSAEATLGSKESGGPVVGPALGPGRISRSRGGRRSPGP